MSRRSILLTLRVSAKERDRVLELAKLERRNVSSLLRWLVSERLREHGR